MEREIVNTVRAFIETNKSFFEKKNVVIAVSGGADSIALLTLVHELSLEYSITPIVVTVNHNIRAAEESESDAVFVQNYCKTLNPPVQCIKIDVPVGEIHDVQKSRDRGIEEAARYVRYTHLESVRNQYNASCILTGHNRSDQLETLLMRLLKGFGRLRGIANKRACIFRPLLDVSRKTIESYLQSHSVSWVTDATNDDLSYLRNKFRKVIVPFLDTQLEGWQTSLLDLSSSLQEDEDFISNALRLEWVVEENGLSCDAKELDSLHPALRKRFLVKAFALLGMKKRVPLHIFNVFPQFHGTLYVGDYLFTYKKGQYIFEQFCENKNPQGFCISIVASCAIKTCFGSVLVETRDEKMYITVTGFIDTARSSVCSIVLKNQPCIIRSRKSGDVIAMHNGKRKTLKKIFNDWSVSIVDRDRIPVIEQQGSVTALCGSVLGYKDWIINHKEL